MMDNATQVLWQYLDERGYRGRAMSPEHIHDLYEAVEGRHARGDLDEEFYQQQLTGFSYVPPAELPDPVSLIVVAVPAPQVRVVFAWQGGRFPLIIPPTYVGYRATTRRVVQELAAFLEPWGYRAAATSLPLKTLAVGSGLGAYGRNNICYVPGMGTFHQLVGCYSDFPCAQDQWPGPTMLPRCEKCRACAQVCPTGAISSERFLLHAERCLTFHNEREREFPAWIDPSSHHVLIGCMQCQRSCPENKPFLSWVVEGVQFAEDETRLLLQAPAIDQLPGETAAKVSSLGLTAGWDILSRNLAAVLERGRGL